MRSPNININSNCASAVFAVSVIITTYVAVVWGAIDWLIEWLITCRSFTTGWRSTSTCCRCACRTQTFVSRPQSGARSSAGASARMKMVWQWLPEMNFSPHSHTLTRFVAVDYEPVINEVDVPVVGKDTCNDWLQENNVNVTDTMICAGLPEGGRDACQVKIYFLFKLRAF